VARRRVECLLRISIAQTHPPAVRKDWSVSFAPNIALVRLGAASPNQTRRGQSDRVHHPHVTEVLDVCDRIVALRAVRLSGGARSAA